MTSFPIAALRSVDLVVPDLARAEAFYTDIWGLSLAGREGGAVLLHGTGADHHILALHEGPAAAIASMTFRVHAADSLDGIAARTLEHGGAVLRPAGAVDWPGGGTGLVIADKQGSIIRLVHGDTLRAPSPPARDRPERLSHVNINSRDTDACTAFYADALGFRLSDRSRMMAFVRTNGEHHTIVIADAPVDGLNHVAFMMPDLEGVMRGAGRLVDGGFPIAWGVGRHGPGDNVFAYFIDPFGIVVEYTAEVLPVDESYVVRGPKEWVWPPGRTDQWGIAPPKSEAVKQAQLAIPFLALDAAV